MDRYLNSEEVSRLTDITTNSLRGLRYSGKGPKFLKPTARKVLYRESDVLAWLDASERTITGNRAGQVD